MNRLNAIEKAFSMLKNDQSATNLTKLSNALMAEFKKAFSVEVVDGPEISEFVMATTPDTTTLDKVLNYAADNSSKIETIMSIWQGANNWKLSINWKVLELFSPQELTAVTCHEVWHVLYSDRAVNRIGECLSFLTSTSRLTQGMIMTSEKFKRLVRLPGLISCQFVLDAKKTLSEARCHREHMTKELKADTFSADNGYRESLISAIKKLTKAVKSSKKTLSDRELRVVANLVDRQDALAKMNLAKLRVGNREVVECCDKIYTDWFGNDLCVYPEIYTEGVNPFARRLEPIRRNQIDYAQTMAYTIETRNDKLMVLSYVNSKLDLAEWYIDILGDEKLSKKYKVPHSLDELIKIKERLEVIRDKAINTRVNYDDRNIVVYYPQNYDG